MTVDESYSESDAREMAKNKVAIVPTLSIGCFLSMNFGEADNGKDEEVSFYQEMMDKHVKRYIVESTIPQLRRCSTDYYDFVLKKANEKKMPEVGTVHKDRVLGFAKNAPKV